MAPSTALALPAIGRAQLTLTQIAESWRRDARGQAYVESLKAFLAGLASRNTVKQYTYAITEFFEWYESEFSRIPPPHEVTRERALKFAQWLRTRSVGLVEHRLKKNPERGLDLEIYRIVKGSPGIHIDAIRQKLLMHVELTRIAPYRPNEAARSSFRVLTIEEDNPEGLERHLGCLVEARVLMRTPSIDDIRSRRVIVDDDQDPRRAQLDYRVNPNVFAYSIAQHTEPEGPARSSTVATRLTALKSFWRFMIQSGENTPGWGDPLLKYNVWDTASGQAWREARSQQQTARILKTPDLDIFNRLLGTTYQAMADGNMVPSRDLEDIRDRAVLLFMLYVAGRADEIAHIRRSDVVWGNEPLVSILGKGNKKRLVRIPDQAYQAVVDLTGKLEELAQVADRAHPDTMSYARYLLGGDAPLFPPLARWGCNAQVNRRKELPPMPDVLTRQSITKMLRRRADEAGFLPKTREYAKIHPHGFRHLAAKMSTDAGTPLPVIQGVLGHSSIATTGTYTEIHDPRKLTLFGWVSAAAPPSTAIGVAPAVETAQPQPIAPPVKHPVAPTVEPVQTPPRPRKQVIDVAGIPVEEGPPPPMPAPPPEERLQAVGALPLPVEEGRVAAELDAIYASKETWGEPGSRQELTTDRAYAGKRSGLVWWLGPTGNLSPAMPVISPAQVAGEETEFGSIRDKLGDIWTQWMDMGDQDNRGPTAAFSLLAWLRDALDVTYETAVEIDKRDGHWVRYLAPIDDTLLRLGERRRVVREQRDDKVADWFHEVAWQHRLSRGRTESGGRPPRVVDTPLEIPAWYALEDPVADLADTERAELFDWLSVLIGRSPIDDKPRYGKASRRRVALLLDLMCTYDSHLDELKRAQRNKEETYDLRQTVADDRDAVNLLAQQLSGQTFDIGPVVQARIAETRQKKEAEAIRKIAGSVLDEEDKQKEKRESRRKFYMQVVGRLFGSDAAKDDVLALFAYCNQDEAPLSGWLYPQLFNIVGKTIQHSPAFAEQFAKETGGAHSECVARRIARHLWELRKSHLAKRAEGGRGERLITDRPDELVEWVHSMAFFKIPCPRAMEQQLRDRISDRRPIPVFDEWQHWRDQIRRRQVPTATTREAEVAAEFAEQAERHKGAAQAEFAKSVMEPNARQREYVYRANMRRYVPTPVVLLCCLYAR